MFKLIKSARAWSAIGCLALAVTAYATASPSGESTADEPYGHLELKSSSGELCNIPITYTTVEKMGWKDDIPGCNFSNFSKVRFVNTPSAVVVKIRSFELKRNWESKIEDFTDCRNERTQYPYRVDLKTTGAITEGEAFDIDDALSTTVNQAVTSNVRLQSKSIGRHHLFPINEHFSCFHFYPDMP